MSPAAIAAILSLVEELIVQAPGIYSEIQSIFTTSTPTPLQWQALRNKVASDSFGNLAPNVELVAPTGTPGSPATSTGPATSA